MIFSPVFIASHIYSNKSKRVTPHCGKIASPKTNEKEVIESCLKIYNLIKTEGAPDGVLLDPTKVCIVITLMSFFFNYLSRFSYEINYFH